MPESFFNKELILYLFSVKFIQILQAILFTNTLTLMDNIFFKKSSNVQLSIGNIPFRNCAVEISYLPPFYSQFFSLPVVWWFRYPINPQSLSHFRHKRFPILQRFHLMPLFRDFSRRHSWTSSLFKVHRGPDWTWHFSRELEFSAHLLEQRVATNRRVDLDWHENRKVSDENEVDLESPAEKHDEAHPDDEKIEQQVRDEKVCVFLAG